MAEFDEKLNSILSNPEAMAQIMQMAQSFSAPSQPSSASPDVKPSPAVSASPPPPLPDAGLVTQLLPLLQELGGQRDSNARQLLYALRPYLKPQRQDKVERALQLARLFCLGRRFLSEWEG